MNRVFNGLQLVKSRIAGLWRSESGDAPTTVMILGVAALILFAVMTVVGINATGDAASSGIWPAIVAKLGELITFSL